MSSGQPYKKFTDVEKYRNQYIEALNMRQELDNIVHQAVKNYKDTGAIPAVSQMKDTRTTSEILADTEKLKRDLAGTLAKVSSLEFGNDVVQRIIKHPANIDNSLLVFASQRANDMMERLKKIYTYGIKGDPNDVQRIVNLIVKMYNDEKSIISSTKDFVNNYYNANVGGFVRGGQNAIGITKDAITRSTVLLSQLKQMLGNNILVQRIDNILRVNNILMALLPNDQGYLNDLDTLLVYMVDIGNNGDNVFDQIQYDAITEYKAFLKDGIPDVSSINIILDKLNKNMAGVLNEDKLNEILMSLESVLIGDRTIAELNNLYRLYRMANINEMAHVGEEIERLHEQRQQREENLQQQNRPVINLPPQPAPVIQPALEAQDDNDGSQGNGFRPRGRGRPKGSGIKKKYAETVAKSISDEGIEPERRFIKFGRYLINTKKLNDGILAVKRPSGNGISDFPSQRISNNLRKVLKIMIGGGTPIFSDLEALSEPERAYLHKLASKADIVDKFNIPTPSKTKYEQDIHDFEVMRGEIMSGNDSKELVKKFKIHILKLSKLGALPKSEVQDILETLLELGY